MAEHHAQRLILTLAPLLLLLALVAGATPHTRAAVPGATGSPLYAQHPCTAVMDAPAPTARMLTQLIGGSEVTEVASGVGNGAAWDQVHFWSGLTGYVLATDLASTPPAQSDEGVCTFPGLPDTTSAPTLPSPGPWPIDAAGQMRAPAALLAAPDAIAFPLDSFAAGQAVHISEWAADPSGNPWYHVSADNTAGWLPVTSVQLDEPSPASRLVGLRPIWQPVAGKGIWFTNYLPHHSDVDALVRAAQLAGLTHLYAEVAISQYGFYGRNTLDRLLPAAHAAGIKVIAWVYPTLADVASDVRLTQQVATYRAPNGDRADGIAADIEEVTTEPAVYAYGQMVRTLLGPDELLVASVLHPLTHAGYPYGAIGAFWNVVAPMDYWHGRRDHVYSPTEVRRFVTLSLTTVRAALGQDTALEETGQSYDMYTDDGAGGSDAPTASELTADLASIRHAGGIGASYFDWQTMTQAEWQVLSSAAW
jgi:hypothetical protein